MDMPRSRQQLRAVLQLRELVISGFFKPGQRISELSLVNIMEISRTPIRLALGQLAYEGLLKPLPSGGFVVNDFSISDIFDAIDIRGTLEGTAARMAAERLNDPDEVAPLMAIYEAIETLIRQRNTEGEIFEKYIELNEQFHNEMLRLAKCPLLERSLSQITSLPFASPNAFITMQGQDDLMYDILFHAQHQHKAIIEAIMSRDNARAFSLGQEHARLAASNLRTAMEQDSFFSEFPGSELVIRDEEAKV